MTKRILTIFVSIGAALAIPSVRADDDKREREKADSRSPRAAGSCQHPRSLSWAI